MKRALTVLGSSLFLFSCSHAVSNDAPSPSTPNETEAVSTRHHALATLQTREGRVTLLGGGGELRVRLRDGNGAVVAENLSLDELKARDPEAWRLVTRAQASTEADGTYLDATGGGASRGGMSRGTFLDARH
jgi:hypothetical protein